MDLSKTIQAIIILGNDGRRILAKHYDDKVKSNQFDRQIYAKTKNRKTKNDILILNSSIVLHRSIADSHIYVIGKSSENPLILEKVLSCIVEVVTTLTNRDPERQSMFSNLSQLIIAVDEICDEGIILEVDPSLILDRVCLADGVADQSLAQVLQSATEGIRFPWLSS